MPQQQLVELAMPDGQVIWAVIEARGPRDTGLGDQIVQKLEGFQQSLQAVAANVRSALAASQPEEVCVEFGLELAAGKNGMVAALAGVGGKATFKVALKWTADASAALPPTDTSAIADSPAPPSPAGT
ncbi:CU044_2847 family protein [Streptomyces sp. NPDC005146]